MDWLLCVFHNFSDHLFLIIREPGYWYQQPLSDYKKCQIAVCSSVAYETHWDPQWQPDTTGVVITPLQQIHIDNRGQPACRSIMGLGWGCPIDWSRYSKRKQTSADGTAVPRCAVLHNITKPSRSLRARQQHSVYYTNGWPSSIVSYADFKVKRPHIYNADIDGLAQDCGNSSALALELPQSYAKPSII